MPTGSRCAPARVPALALVCVLLVTLPGCEVIHEPVVSVTLMSQPATITGTGPAQLLATVTEDGVPQEGLEVLFTAGRGTFSDATQFTDAVGLAVSTLTLPDDDDTNPVEVTATAVEAGAMVMLTVTVEAGGGR